MLREKLRGPDYGELELLLNGVVQGEYQICCLVEEVLPTIVEDSVHSLTAREVKESMLESFWCFQLAYCTQLRMVGQNPGYSLSCG